MTSHIEEVYRRLACGMITAAAAKDELDVIISLFSFPVEIDTKIDTLEEFRRRALIKAGIEEELTDEPDEI